MDANGWRLIRNCKKQTAGAVNPILALASVDQGVGLCSSAAEGVLPPPHSPAATAPPGQPRCRAGGDGQGLQPTLCRVPPGPGCAPPGPSSAGGAPCAGRGCVLLPAF